MGDTLDIAAVRDELKHAADHLTQALDSIDKPYHDGEEAPAQVIHDLLPWLNSIGTYAQTAVQALLVMATGGLTENDGENWMIGDHGPFDTLAEALDWRADNDDVSEFILQTHEPEDD